MSDRLAGVMQCSFSSAMNKALFLVFRVRFDLDCLPEFMLLLLIVLLWR